MPGNALERRPVHLPVPVERRRESEAAIPRVARAYRRNYHLSVPLTVPPACWACATVMHSVPHGAGITLVGSGIAAAWTWGRAPGKWDRHEKWHRDEVLYARASALAASGWLSLASWLGPLDGAPGSIAFGASLVALSAAWGYPWWRHKRPRGRRKREKLLREHDGGWQHNAPSLGLPGSRVIDVADSPAMTRVRIQLVRGKQTIADVRAALPRIESAIDDIDEGRVSVHPVAGHRSQVELRIKRDNPLREDVTWDEAIAPRSVLDPWHPGLTESGQWRAMRQLAGIWANGETGSGKSTLLLDRLLSLAGCDDAFSILIDRKGGRSARPVLETRAADWVITGQAEAELAYQLAEAEILARAEGLYDGHEQAKPTRRDPAIFIHVDETHHLTSFAKGTAQAANSMSVVATTGRSSLVHEDVITQYGALEASVRTEETRMNLGLRFAFRMPRAELASYAIKEYQQLDVSLLEEPGECYASDEPRASMERMRVVNVSHDEFRRIAPARVARRGPKPPLKLWCGAQPCPAGGTWQEFLDSRWGRLPEGLRAISPQYHEWAASQPRAADDATAPGTAQAAAPEPRREVSMEAAEIAARIAAEAEEYAGVPDGPLAKGSPRLADVLAAQQDAFCDALSPEGATVAQLVTESGCSKTWAYDTLPRLAQAGAVAEVRRGLWACLPGADVHAALAGLKATDAMLKADAKAITRRSKIHAA